MQQPQSGFLVVIVIVVIVVMYCSSGAEEGSANHSARPRSGKAHG
jgi:uncharacterized membrane protein